MPVTRNQLNKMIVRAVDDYIITKISEFRNNYVAQEEIKDKNDLHNIEYKERKIGSIVYSYQLKQYKIALKKQLLNTDDECYYYLTDKYKLKVEHTGRVWMIYIYENDYLDKTILAN